MHVIIDGTTTQDQLAYAGIGQYSKNIILSLIKLYPETDFSILLFNDKESTLGDNLNRYSNVKIVDIGGYRVSDYRNDIWYLRDILPKIKKIRREDSLYFCPYFWRNFPSDIMPTVLFVHDMILPMFGPYSQQSFFHNWIRKLQYWMTLDKSVQCRYILCNSETTKNDFLKYYPEYPAERTVVTYLGVDLEEREVSLDGVLPKDWERRGYLIYLGGGVTKNKNSEGVIKGYAEFVRMLNKDKPPYLVIAGGKFKDQENKDVKALHELIDDLGIRDSVIFTGFYSDDSKYSLLKNAFTFIHLSTYEGFGISVAEALRAKVPTVIDKNLVYIELFDDVSSIVDGYDEQKVGRKILDIYQNPNKYSQMVQRGYKLSKSFTWDECAKKSYKIFEKALA